MSEYISKNFNISFGQHSGVIDVNKEKYELPRFPINEKYGELKRFNSIINYSPLEYKSLRPIEKKLDHKKNPPQFNVEFFNDQKNFLLSNLVEKLELDLFYVILVVTVSPLQFLLLL